MSALGDRIAALIASQGPITIAQYMTLALLDPAQGYYATRKPFGAEGDFITAPEISQMFGELIGLWLAQTWTDQGKPERPLLVELGPGSGTLMADALRALKLVPEFRDQAEVVMVETSGMLQAEQWDTLLDCGKEIRWSETFDATPADRPLFLIANEFFDALPIRQFVRTERGWCERMVGLDANGELGFALSPAPYPAAPPGRDGAPRGGVFEMSPAGESIAEQIGHAIATRGGAALVADYGYDAPGFGETLQAVHGHAFADILADPGASDLTAHVDFRALAGAARRGGAAACGPVEQGAFLDALGIRQRAERLAQSEQRDLSWRGLTNTPSTVERQLERLTGAEHMGSLFKALAIVPKTAPTPPGF